MNTLNDRLVAIIEGKATSMWLCNPNALREPDVVRLMGARVEAGRGHVVAYVPERSGADLLGNLADSPRLTLLTALIHTYESYQVKGTYTGHRACTPEEVEYQRAYVEGFAESSMHFYGLPKEKIVAAYFRHPAVAVRLRVEELYEQTPRKGTGARIVP